MKKTLWEETSGDGNVVSSCEIKIGKFEDNFASERNLARVIKQLESKKKVCFIAQFPPPMHGLSKAIETLYNSELNAAMNPDGEFEFEKVDIANNKNFLKNLQKIGKSKADLFYFTISQTKGGNLRDLVILKLLELQHKKCLIHLHGGYYRQLVDNDMAGW